MRTSRRTRHAASIGPAIVDAGRAEKIVFAPAVDADGVAEVLHQSAL
jgi:hypothetical protein